MRGGFAGKSADRISSTAVTTAVLLSVVVGGGFAFPLARFDPFRAPRHGDWIIQTTIVKSAHPISPPAVTVVAAQMAPVAPAPAPTSAPSQAPVTRSLVVTPPVTPTTSVAPTTPAQTTVTRSVVTTLPPTPAAPAGFMLASAESRPVPPPPTPAPVATRPAADKMPFAARWKLTGIAARDRADDDDVPTGTVHLALADESTPVVSAPPPAPVHVPPATQVKPFERKNETKRDVDPMEEVDNYLWAVYERTPIKKDSTGDFSWKDPAAAKKRGISLQAYVIGGMEPDFREQLYHAGHAMDAAGLQWSMLSAFRDDYRQALAEGFKARPGNSLHGGSRATGGYGHGRAIDIMNAGGDDEDVWHWLDAHGRKYGLRRPMPGYDPAHIQAGGDWHAIAHTMREGRTRIAGGTAKSKSAKAGM
jgi:hypothetical protein